MSRAAFWVMVLAVLVMASAIAVIEVKHESRKRFSQLQSLQRQRNDMEVEWGQLQLEQGTWSSHSRVERIARRRLNMHAPQADNTVIIQQEDNQK